MKKEQKLIFRLLPLLIAAVIAALLPQMIRNEYYMTIACQILIYLIAVCGLNFITGLTGQMNLGTAGMFAMGAYVSGLLNVKLGVSPWLGLVAALCVGWLIGKALGYPSLRLRGVYLSLTTIAFTEIIRMLLNNMKGVTNGAQGLRGIERYNFFGYRIEGTIPYYYMVLIVAILVVWFAWRIAVFDLTDKSHGNFGGLGSADVTTQRLYRKIDFEQTYPNGITAAEPLAVRLPVIMPSDRTAMQFALRTATDCDWSKGPRIVWLKNTLSLSEFYISEALIPDAEALDNVTVVSEPMDVIFDEEGNVKELR